MLWASAPSADKVPQNPSTHQKDVWSGGISLTISNEKYVASLFLPKQGLACLCSCHYSYPEVSTGDKVFTGDKSQLLILILLLSLSPKHKQEAPCKCLTGGPFTSCLTPIPFMFFHHRILWKTYPCSLSQSHSSPRLSSSFLPGKCFVQVQW